MAESLLFLGEYIGFAGGIERYAYQTALALREAGIEVDYEGSVPARGENEFRKAFRRVFAPGEADGEYTLAILHKLCPFPVLKKLRGRFGERLIFWAHDHDLYCMRRHYYTPFGRVNCHRACSFLRCTVCSRLSSPRGWKRSPITSLRLLNELRRHRAVVLSHFMYRNLLKNGFAPENISLIPPFADVTEPRTDFMPDGVLRLLFLGQLIRGKGCDLLLDAASRLRVPFRLTIAGDGSDRPMLEALAAKKGIADRVEFAGWVSDPETYLNRADLLIFPTRWQEPFGLGGLEALARGLPVAAFRLGGVEDWLPDSAGYSVPEGDTAALARAIESHTRDAAIRMSANAVRFVRQNFSRERFLNSVRSLMENVK